MPAPTVLVIHRQTPFQLLLREVGLQHLEHEIGLWRRPRGREPLPRGDLLVEMIARNAGSVLAISPESAGIRRYAR